MTVYLLPNLCNSIEKYLKHILNSRNYGEIFQVAKMIGSEEIEKDVIREWISKSDSFNENDEQIKTLIRDFDGVEVNEGDGVMNEEGGDEELSSDAIIGISRRMIAESCWNGESESKLSVVKCLASLLSLGTGTKKRKM